MSKLLSSNAARSVKHVDQFKETLTTAADAAIGVLLIRTREPFRAQEVLQEWAIENEMDFRVWTILSGWQQFPRAGDDPEIDITTPTTNDNVIDVAKAIKSLSDGFPLDGCFVMMNPQHTFQAPAVQQHIKAHVQRAMDNRQRLVLLVPESTDIPPEIEDDIHVLDFKAPSHVELRQFWDDMLENVEEDCHPPFDDDDVDLIIQQSLGMTQLEFDTALAKAYVVLRDRLTSDEEDEQVTPWDFIRIVMDAKVEVIKKTDILELMPEAKMSEVGGLDLLKEWLELRALAFSDEAKEYGIDNPKGVLVVGPPGSGKSLFGKATARVLGVPCIKFDVGRVFGQFVGQSESRMRKALKLVEAMAPCVLFVDEIDKAFGGAGGGGSDGGTSSRVFGTFLTWMQERHADGAPIFVVATANNVSNLPPELMRKGRFDEIFAVTFPGYKERADILRIHVEKRGHKLGDEDYAKFAKATPEYVGAEIEGCVQEAILRDFKAGRKNMSIDTLLAEASKITPLSKAFPEKVKFMQEWAKNNAKAASSDMANVMGEAEAKPSSGAGARTIRRPLGKRRVKPARKLDD